MSIPYTLSPQDVAGALVKLTAASVDANTVCSGSADDCLRPRHISDPLNALYWSPRISCGALPSCLPLSGDSMIFFEQNGATGVVRACINSSEHFLLHKTHTNSFLGFLHVSLASSRLVTQRSGDCLQFSVMNHSAQASDAFFLPSSFEMLKREVVLWIMQVSAASVGKTKQTKLAEIESQFPFLMLLSPAQRDDYVMQAIDTYAHGAIVWFDKTAIVETGLPTYFCTNLVTKGVQRGISALQLALNAASVLGDYAKIEKLCHSLRVILDTHLKSANVTMSPHLLKCVSIAFQVMCPFLNEGLKISERPPCTLIGQLDLILDYCETEGVDKLAGFFDSKSKFQKRKAGRLPLLVSVVQHASCHRRRVSIRRESCSVRPKQPLIDNASAFFASFLPSDSQQTPNTLAIDKSSLKSFLIDQWDGEKTREVSLFKGSKCNNLQKNLLSELIFSIQPPVQFLLRSLPSAQENVELKLFIGKRSRRSEESVSDEAESYALDIIRQRAISKRYRGKS